MVLWRRHLLGKLTLAGTVYRTLLLLWRILFNSRWVHQIMIASAMKNFREPSQRFKLQPKGIICLKNEHILTGMMILFHQTSILITIIIIQNGETKHECRLHPIITFLWLYSIPVGLLTMNVVDKSKWII
jgi:hypothetical protein